jgi:type II secretory pathway component GspD/PulD (secretin)
MSRAVASLRWFHRGDGPRSACAFLVLLFLFAVIASAQQLEVIELRYRLVEDVLPVVQPLVEPGGVITGSDHMLFVRTSPSNLEQIRQAVAALDRKPRQLTVSVGQGTVTRLDAADVRGAASFGSDEVRVGVNAPPGSETGVAVGARAVSQRANLHNVSTVQTMEDSETWIGAGQSVPITTTEVVPGRRGPVEVSSTGYREVSTGFFATVRVSGEYVTLEITPQQQRLHGSPGAPVIATAGSSSTVHGRLGEWIPLGGVSESSNEASVGLLAAGGHRETSQYTTWVKVEEVP